ncbi:hypothetical protein M1512_00730 [Patescibacteria group bacterium]|nr:hypothetical protein [Patescibacteria group bacterium]
MSSPIPRSTLSQQLLLTVAEQLKLPLIQIARQAELAAFGMNADLTQIRTLAENGLKLIDGYSLGLQLANLTNYELAPEAVSVASVLYEADEQLKALARLYSVELELNISGRYEPVLAHRQGLQAAIVGLASALIEALPAQASGTSQTTLQLATHRCRYGIVAGVYANIPNLSSEALRSGRKLYGRSRQPLVEISHTTGAGIFVADAIFRAMKLKLHVSRHHRLYGLGVVLQPSSQLALV